MAYWPYMRMILIISTKTTITYSTAAKKSIVHIISTSLHKHVSARTAFALFVDIFDTCSAEKFKFHCQKA